MTKRWDIVIGTVGEHICVLLEDFTLKGQS